MKKILLISTILFLSACGSKSAIPTKVPTPVKTPSANVPAELKPVEIEMTASKFRFQPNIIKVKTGQDVTLKLKSKDVVHGISIPDLGVASLIAPGETPELKFTAPKPGSYEFFCNIPCGSGHSGMRGTIVVTE